MPFLSSYLRRLGRLAGARRALLAGSPEEALLALDDPVLSLSPAARRLRAEVLDVLCREAVRRRVQGRDRSVARILGVLAGESAARAEECRRRLAWLEAPRAAGSRKTPAPADEPGPAAEPPRAPGSSASAPGAGPAGSAGSAAHGASPGAARPTFFELAVDDGGQHLVAVAAELVIGHLKSGRADLGFLADVGAEHARLTRRESLREGPGWYVTPIGDERVLVNGAPVPEAGRRLAHDDRVELAVNLALRFHVPDPASGTVRLELLRGAECAGCGSIVLLAEGAGGRLRIGSPRNRHVRVGRLKEDVVLQVEGGELSLSCAEGLRVAGGAPVESLRLALPPDRRRDFEVGSASAEGPPLALAVSPVEGPGRRA